MSIPLAALEAVVDASGAAPAIEKLTHLGLVDDGRSVPLAAGAWASAGDLIVARENDHRLVTDPGHTLANGDRFVVDAVTGEGLLVRRVLESEHLAERPVLYPAAKLATTDLGSSRPDPSYGPAAGWSSSPSTSCQTGKPPTKKTAVDFNEGLAREAAAISDQDECDDPDCACHQDVGEWPGDGGGHDDRGLRGRTWVGPPLRLVTRCGLETSAGHSK